MHDSRSPIELRRATHDDASSLALLMERANAYRDEESMPDAVNEAQSREMLIRMSEPDAWSYIAADGDKIAGFVLGFPGDGLKDSVRKAEAEYISLLMVDPEYWGRRIASRLIDFVAEKARTEGKQELTLWTRDESNEHTRTFYEHKGFALSGLKRVSRYGRQVHYRLGL